MKYLLNMATKNESKVEYNVIFDLDYENIEEITNDENRLDDLALLINIDNNYTYDGNTFVKRSKEKESWYEIEKLDEERYNKICKNMKMKLPSGDAEKLLDVYSKKMGFLNFEDAISSYNKFMNGLTKKR